MAEGKTGGVAGLFAKQVQKTLNRAQEKVGGRSPGPRSDSATRPAGALGPGGWCLASPGKREWGVGVHENSQMDEKAEPRRRVLSRDRGAQETPANALSGTLNDA